MVGRLPFWQLSAVSRFASLGLRSPSSNTGWSFTHPKNGFRIFHIGEHLACPDVLSIDIETGLKKEHVKSVTDVFRSRLSSITMDKHAGLSNHC